MSDELRTLIVETQEDFRADPAELSSETDIQERLG